MTKVEQKLAQEVVRAISEQLVSARSRLEDLELDAVSEHAETVVSLCRQYQSIARDSGYAEC